MKASIARRAVARGMSLALAAGVATPALATENGQTHADLSFIATLAGIPLPPGFYVRTDSNYDYSTHLNDQDGNDTYANLGPRGGRQKIKFYNSSFVQVFTFAYVPNVTIPYINATVLSAIYGFYGASRAEAKLSVFGHYISGRGETVYGLGDFTIVPAALGWSFKSIDSYVRLAPFTFTVPNGQYRKEDPIGNNLGTNYVSYRPALEYTYLNATGQEFSTKLSLSINSQNNATHYKSGDEYYQSFAFQQHTSPEFAFGFEGNYYKQFTDDTRNGRVVNTAIPGYPVYAYDPLNEGPGNRGEAFAIGPTISYNPAPNIFLNFHFVHDVFAYDREQKEQFWARASIRF